MRGSALPAFCSDRRRPLLAEQNLCPAAAFDRGICNHSGIAFALSALLHLSMALVVLGVRTAAVLIAASHQKPVLWATLAVLPLAAACLGDAGNAWSLFVAALAGGVLAAMAIRRFLRVRWPGQSGDDQPQDRGAAQLKADHEVFGPLRLDPCRIFRPPAPLP